MTVKEFLKNPEFIRDEYEDFLIMRTPLELGDGERISIQASSGHYASPRINLLNGDYECVELGYPTFESEELRGYAEDGENLKQTVYGYVPVEVVEKVVEAHGGIKGPVDMEKWGK